MARKKLITASDISVMTKSAEADVEEKKQDARVKYWLNEISAARKREKDYRKEGQRIISICGGRKIDETPYNILYSNTETLLPALYSAIPRPVVQRRFKDDDPLGKFASEAGKRALEFLVDTNVDGYETFDEGMRCAVLDALLPGRGITCVKYDAEVGVLPTESVDDSDPNTGDDGVAQADAMGESEPMPDEYKKSELVCVDTRSWNRVYFGYAKKWSKVPWIAYEEHIDEEEAERLFGDVIAKKLVYTGNETGENKADDADSGDRGSQGDSPDDRDIGERKTVCIYQIWDKDGGKKIRYVTAQYQDGFLKVEDDPLELTGFFNCPKPIQFTEKSNDMMPVALYTLYENQAKELNRLTQRINRIVEAIKARGVYDGELGEDIANLMKADDNALVPADKSASLAAEKGLQNAIWFMPIEQLVNVLAQLYQAREQCKRVIYEITGISDIIRGSSIASETATAQTLKSQWGTLRLKRLQKEVQRYARDLLRMMLEIAATKFSEDTWAKMTGLPFTTTMEAQQLQQVAMAAQMSGQPLDPQTQQKLQAPQWAQVLTMLRDDTQRAYRIDIETNSTVEPEAAEDQKNISELLNALAQYLNGVGPLVAKGVMPFEAAQSMMMAIVRRFRFGSEIEEYVKQMKAPPKEDDGNAAEQAKMQADMQIKQQEAQQNAQKHEMDMRAKGMDAQISIEESKMRMAAEQQRAETERMRAELERVRMNLEMRAAEQEHAYKMEELRSKHEVGMAAGALKLATMREQAKRPAPTGKPS